MIGVSEEELKRDRERLMNFIKENPYPDYNFIEYDLLLKQKQSLEQYAEYGEINHDLMKEIYENIFDKDLIKKHGERYTIEEEWQHYNKTIIHYCQCWDTWLTNEDLIETQSFWRSTTSKRLFLNVGME